MRAPRVPRHRTGHLELGPTSGKENSSVHDEVLEDRVHVKRAPRLCLSSFSSQVTCLSARAVQFPAPRLQTRLSTGKGVGGDRVHGGVVRWGEAKEFCPRIPRFARKTR
jgi:hypothetical protein